MSETDPATKKGGGRDVSDLRPARVNGVHVGRRYLGLISR